tara:strand:+ start:213 stop:386 length:174 start_codon:yes stop_codon:yes gene_type:complete
MDKNKLASIIARLHFCNGSKLENIDEWQIMKKDLLELNDYEFGMKLSKFGLLDKEAS